MECGGKTFLRPLFCAGFVALWSCAGTGAETIEKETFAMDRSTKKIPAQTGVFLKAGAGILSLFLLAAPASAQAGQDRYCREYTRTVWIDGRAQSAYGTACLQPDGAWQIVNENGHDSRRYETIVFRDRVVEPPPRIVERVVVWPAPYPAPHSWDRGRHIRHHRFHDRDWNKDRKWHRH